MQLEFVLFTILIHVVNNNGICFNSEIETTTRHVLPCSSCSYKNGTSSADSCITCGNDCVTAGFPESCCCHRRCCCYPAYGACFSNPSCLSNNCSFNSKMTRSFTSMKKEMNKQKQWESLN